MPGLIVPEWGKISVIIKPDPMKTKYLLLLFLATIFLACQNDRPKEEKREKIELVTTKGTIFLELYNETPKHRDNFLKLAKEGILDSLLFHRVINQFMIQTGDTDSKNATSADTLGNGDLAYKVDAEIHPNLFHKRGALGAARDGNPARASSSTQFYIVQRGPRADSLIDIDQTRINGWLAEHFMQKDSVYRPFFDARNEAMKNQDMQTYLKYSDSLRILAESFTGYEKYTIPEAHREVYRTIGGTPHLDQNYTVFGEVIEGMEVVDAIAEVETNQMDRPIEDVRVLSVRVVRN
jgi:cyclophilin family peptidyl-prolyl cis-trans isomerase